MLPHYLVRTFVFPKNIKKRNFIKMENMNKKVVVLGGLVIVCLLAYIAFFKHRPKKTSDATKATSTVASTTTTTTTPTPTTITEIK